MRVTIEYDLQRSDLEAFHAHHAQHAPYLVATNRRMRWFWGVVFLLLALVARPTASALIPLIVGGLYLAFYPRINRWWYVRHNRRLSAGADGPRLGAAKVAFADGKLHSVGPDGSSTYELSAIRRIEESQSHYFLYVGPSMAVVVPKRSDEAGALVEAVRRALPAA